MKCLKTCLDEYYHSPLWGGYTDDKWKDIIGCEFSRTDAGDTTCAAITWLSWETGTTQSFNEQKRSKIPLRSRAR